jgi:hypothetical protein
LKQKLFGRTFFWFIACRLSRIDIDDIFISEEGAVFNILGDGFEGGLESGTFFLWLLSGRFLIF